METMEIIREIRGLPIGKRMLVIERALKSIRMAELQKKMKKATAVLFDDYLTDKKLTAFTSVDFDNFYKAR